MGARGPVKSLGPWIVGLLLLGVLGWEACQGSRSLAEWEADTTRTFQGVQAREDSAEAMLALGMRLVEQGEQAKREGEKLAQRGQSAFRAALHLRDSLSNVAIPDTCLPLAREWARAHDSLVVAVRSTQAGFDSLLGSYALLERSYLLQLQRAALFQESSDSLTALVRRAPEECRVLGVPCPRVYVGVGLVESGGTIRVGPSLGVGFRVPF